MASYIFGGNTGETAESIARQREVADALWAQSQRGGAPKTIGDGLALVGQALSRRASLGAADEAQAKGQAADADLVAAIMGGAPAPVGQGGVGSDAAASANPPPPQNPLAGMNPAVIGALTSPYASEGTKSIAKLLIDQEMKKRAQAAEGFTLGQGQQRFDGAGNVVASGPAKLPDGTGEYGLTPVWGLGPDGKPALMQLGKNGTPIQPKLPDGFQIQRDPIKVETPTQTVLLDPQTRQVIGSVPKDIAGAKAAEVTGTATGEARVALPGAKQMVDTISGQIKSLKEDPYLPSMLGPIASRMPNVTTDAARVQAKMDQLRGGAFMQARQMLKGGGAITDFEGKKAEMATVRMNEAQSLQDFNAALDDFNSAVSEGVGKLESQAGTPAYQSPQNADGTKNQARIGDTPKRRVYNPVTGQLE